MDSLQQSVVVCRSVAAAKKCETKLGDIASNKERHKTASVGNLLDTVASQCGVEEADDEQVFTVESTASESDSEEVKVSKVQKIFAKRSIKREKKREKDHKKKVEKNYISMDDFLSKQSEFKMWLYEEKNKNAGDLSSPKLKSLFKQFVQAWNKRKLPIKYFKSSLTSEASPLTQKKHNYMLGNDSFLDLPVCKQEVDKDRENKPCSPFVTFGKTPPKVFKSKKLQIFGIKPEIALISVAAIGSPNHTKKKSNKENALTADEPPQYQTPAKQLFGPATPYKVSVFPWAVEDDSGNQSLEICSTSTPPNSFKVQETEEWPPPPTEEEINSSDSKTSNVSNRTKDSPHVPPPPPPRSASLTQGNKCHLSSHFVSDAYADPYDKLPSVTQLVNKSVSDYQEPVDTVIRLDNKTQPENPSLVLRSFSQNDEPDTSLYSKPIDKEDMTHLSSNAVSLFEHMKGEAPNIVLDSRPSKKATPRSCDMEELYAKPVKKRFRVADLGVTESKGKLDKELNSDEKKQQGKDNGLSVSENSQDKQEIQSELYSENKKAAELNELSAEKPEPIYESINDCIEKLDSNVETKPGFEPFCARSIHSKVEESSQLIKMKKKTVLAASSDKIYETYLSLRGNPNLMKQKPLKEKSFTSSLCKRFKSQPDISCNEISEHSIKQNQKDDTKSGLEDGSIHKTTKDGTNYMCLTVAQRAMSLENCLKETECPSTPTITATPSFDSLCAVTPLNKRSGSSQSLPMKMGSYESLPASESSMSISSRSTISTVSDVEETWLLENLEEEAENRAYEQTAEVENNLGTDVKLMKNINSYLDNDEKFESGHLPVTPGKTSTAKHGIDLSVYLLKPAKHEDMKTEESICFETVPSSKTSEMIAEFRKTSGESSGSHKNFDSKARLAIKEMWPSGKNTAEIAKSCGKKETDRRLKNQTDNGFAIGSSQKIGLQSPVPKVGIACKTHKSEGINKSGRSRSRKDCQTEEVETTVEPKSKRLCIKEKSKVCGEDLYLETDIDTVTAEKTMFNLRKSKSHSSVEQGSGTVVTEIW